jgi:L-asparaginase II
VIRIQPGVPLVEVERSGVVESVHTGHLVVLGPDGRVRFSAGDPDQPIFPRSSLKPVQAVGMLRAGLVADSEEIALGAASHSGSDLHLRLIAGELAAAGLTEDDLECPPDYPLGEAEYRAYLTAGRPQRRLAMNCSGKHTAMLRTVLAVNAADPSAEWPLSGYLSPGHPLQRALAATVADLTGEQPAATGIDGCGAPLFAVSLTGLARAFATIAVATGGPERQVADAMRSHPELVGGQGRANTVLMAGVGGLIAKDGAEGVFAAALPDGGAFACKIDDGATRAADRVAVLGLRHLGVTAAVLGELEATPLLGGGVPVGSIHLVTG